NKQILLRPSQEELHVRVIGIVKNFHFRSLHEKIGPLVLGHSHNAIQSIDYFTARISGHDIPKTLDYLRQVHERFDSVTPFEYHFLDQQIERFYAADQRLGQLLGIAAGLAIFIASLGLFGLAAFTAEKRTKEIGVRKVLGASVPQIVVLLSKEFSRLVLIALVMAVPAAFIMARTWLQEFAYRIDIGWWVFALAGGLALVIALLTVSTQAVKAALANPVDSLRYE
ncbi:MAG: ABC transporter permease, partial [bacterium]